MKNNQGILNLTNKTISFKFNDEDFVMDLAEGDLHDSWNAFTTKDDVVRDLNFTWDGYSKDDKPVLTVYELTDNGDGTWSTNWQEDTDIKLIEVIGTEGDYFGIPFDGAKTAYFELFDKDGVLKLKTKKFNKACDESLLNNWQQVCIDVYGNRKVISEIREIPLYKVNPFKTK